MSTDNYYELFDVSMDADPATVEAGIKAARRRWRQLTGSPDKERARLAEQRMEQLEAAETTLLDAAARAAYDAELTAQLSAAPVAAAPVAEGTAWGERAKTYYYDGDVRNAYSAAKKGTDIDANDNLAWLVYVWSATDLKRYDDADFASAELVQRAGHVDSSHELRGGVLDAMGRYKEAEISFRKAIALSPSNAYYQGRAAWAVLDQGRLDDAVAEAWTVADRFPGEEYPPKVLRAAADALRDRKRPQDSLKVAQRLLGRDSSDDDAMLLVVLAIQEIETSVNIDVAITEAWQLLDAFPANPRAQKIVRYVIASLRERGRYGEALAQSRALLARFPHDQEVKKTFALSRIADAEANMSATGPGTHIILNKAQAAYYGGALSEIEGLDVTDPGIRTSVASMREYLARQTKTTVKLSFGKVVLALVAIIFFFVGISTIASGGFIWIIIAGLLGWAFTSLALKKQYALNYKSADVATRKRGLQR